MTKKEMKKLVFGEGLMSPSLDGSKRYTVRKYRLEAHDFKKGEVVIGNFKDGLDILLRITDDVIKAPFKDLKRSKGEAERKGGYYFDQKYFDDLKKYYPDLTWETTGAVVYFEVLKVNGVPVVQHNWQNKKAC